jgi:hypothetical protein
MSTKRIADMPGLEYLRSLGFSEQKRDKMKNYCDFCEGYFTCAIDNAKKLADSPAKLQDENKGTLGDLELCLECVEPDVGVLLDIIPDAQLREACIRHSTRRVAYLKELLAEAGYAWTGFHQVPCSALVDVNCRTAPLQDIDWVKG